MSRAVIAAEVQLADVAMQIAGIGEGDMLVELLNECAAVVKRKYGHDSRVKKHTMKMSMGAFLSRVREELDEDATMLVMMLAEHKGT